MDTKLPIDFASEADRTKWLTENAKYYTTVYRKNRRNERKEHRTLKAAEIAAQKMVEEGLSAYVMIYAVYPPHDAFVETIAKGYRAEPLKRP